MHTPSVDFTPPSTKPNRLARARSLPCTLLLLFICFGCATVTPPASPEPPPRVTAGGQPSAPGWWAVRFKMKWAEGTTPSWHLDELVAYEVVSPALERYREQILLWRFHRRAAPDAGGHQFSFIFYATPQDAERIHASIRSSPVLALLKGRGVIEQDTYQDTSRLVQPNIEDTADPRWSLPLKRSWPNFIMGVSEAWLILISELAGERRGGRAGSAEPLVASYETVHKAVEKTWREEGSHALLHHLNALFGYAPLAVPADAHLMRF